MARWGRTGAGWAGAAVIAACASSQSDEHFAQSSAALSISAYRPLTEVYVANAGALDVEGTYLPQVVCCENGNAPSAALQAQAVMARSYMYFRNAADGLGMEAKPFSGTQADQVYHCPRTPSQACRDAVLATKDQVIVYVNATGSVVANVAFYVDGPKPACLASKSCACPQPDTTTPMTPTDHPSTCACFTFASMGAANPKYVTYNWAASGTGVTASTLGSLANESNRGCASQNIQACLAYAGWSYVDLLKFFYGQDVQLRYPDGRVVDPGDGTVPVAQGPPKRKPTAGSASETTTDEPPTDDGCQVAAVGAREPSPTTPVNATFAIALAVCALLRRRWTGRS
jgi:hypothetical protein